MTGVVKGLSQGLPIYPRLPSNSQLTSCLNLSGLSAGIVGMSQQTPLVYWVWGFYFCLVWFLRPWNSLGSLAEDAILNLTILMFSASPELDYSCMLPLPVYMVLDCVGQAPTEPYSTMFLNFDRLFVM